MSLEVQNKPPLTSTSDHVALKREQQLSLFSDADSKPLDAKGHTNNDPFTDQVSSQARPLRICISGYRSAPFGGGQGIYIKYLSKALVEAGHSVDVVSGQPYPMLDQRVNLIKLPGLDLFANGLLSLRPKHLTSLTNIIEWLSKDDCPIEINDDVIEEIAEVCEHQSLQKNRDIFRSKIQKIVSKMVEQHIQLGGK